MAVAVRRLPGISVDVVPRPAVEALPRMDVGVLVGFASTGPVNVPVAVESVAQYSAVFGADAPLAWDATREERVYAYLGPAVRAFFANGGRRCWVVRVAIEPTVNRFAISGVLEVADEGVVTPAFADARSAGSWSDGLQAASSATMRTFALEGLTALSSPADGGIAFRTRLALRRGDLVKLEAQGIEAFAVVSTARLDPNAGTHYETVARIACAFERLAAAASPGSPPAWDGSARVEGFGASVTAALQPPMRDGGAARLEFTEPVPAALAVGHWARFTESGAPVWLRIDGIERRPAFAGSPPAMDSSSVMATVTGPAWREVGAILPMELAASRRGHVVALELKVDDANGRTDRLHDIGLAPDRPDAWWNHAPDDEFHGSHDEVEATPQAVQRVLERARFPLARSASPIPAAWLPLGAQPLWSPATSCVPLHATALERDGLAQFGAGLFVDPELATAPMQTLAELADDIRYFRPQTRVLRGMHAAWSLGTGGLFNEATLLAIPDAVHLGWEPRRDPHVTPPNPGPGKTPPHWHTHRGACAKASEPPLSEPDFGVFLDCATRDLAAPVLDGPDGPVQPGVYRLAWTNSEPQGTYLLVEAAQPDFSDAREIDNGQGTEYLALNPREGVYYYQVFACVGDDRSEGSNAIVVVVRSDDWIQKEPGRDLDEHEDDWLAIQRAALRMAAANGDLFVTLSLPRHFKTQNALRYASRLREVRGAHDMADASALAFTESRALSYGAMYFPWLQSDVRTTDVRRDEMLVVAIRPSAPRIVPPDGFALGILAGRATRRGAWIAAANEPIKDAVALQPPIASGDWQALQDAQINLVRDDPRGFLVLSADTLSESLDVRPINVRRLLILLRRLALRRGVSYVFEPNGPALARAVQRGFEVLLADLFQRGAFAGSTPEQSFRVVTDNTINTPRDADGGRFLVELRVAPALPMRFIAVLLAQSGTRLTVTEEL